MSCAGALVYNKFFGKIFAVVCVVARAFKLISPRSKRRDITHTCAGYLNKMSNNGSQSPYTTGFMALYRRKLMIGISGLNGEPP